MTRSPSGKSRVSPLLLLTLWQIKNAVLHTLRSPRKLVPVLLMAAYCASIGVWAAVGRDARGRPVGPDIAHLLRGNTAVFHSGLFLALVLLATGLLERGFVGGSLRFVPADIDYLFAAPFPRRLVLLFKVGLRILTMAAFAVALAVYSLSHLGRTTRPLPGWALWVALGACADGYLNLSVAIELAFGLGRWPWGRRAVYAVLLLTIAYVGATCRFQGLAGLARISRHGVLPLVFFPCRWAADAASANLGGHGDLAAVWGLLAFYALGVALVFSRNENYYEQALTGAERVWQAVQAQKETPWRLRSRAGASPRWGEFAVPPFGRGAGALFWAHLSASAKNPFVNFGLPVLAGGLLSALAWHTPLESLQLAVGLFAFYYFAATTVFSGLFFFRHALERQALIRPLPLSPRGVVLAEVGPRTALAAPFYLVTALGVVLSHGADAAFLAWVLLALPLMGLCLNLLQMTLALWYPSTDDKIQGLITQVIQLVVVILLMVFLSLLLAIPVRLGAPDWLSLTIFFGGTAWMAGFLLALASGAYAGYQPEGGPITIDRALVRRFLRPAAVVAALGLVGGTVAARISQARLRPPPPPQTVKIHRGDLRVEVEETGTLTPTDQLDVRSKVAGRILTLLVREGQRVRAGQLIATVDRTLLDPQIAQARAQLGQAQARLAQTVAAYRLQCAQTRMTIAQAHAGLFSARTHLAAVAAGARPQELAQGRQAVARARIALDDARRTLGRKQALASQGFLAQSEADAAQTAVDTAQSSLETAQQALALTEAGPRPQDVAAARAQVDAARVQVSAAEGNALQDAVSRSDIAQARAGLAQITGTLSQLEVSAHDTRIVAPGAGRVLKTYKQVGEIVQSATTGFSDTQSLVATLGGRLEVAVGISEGDVSKLRRGAPVSVHVDALPDTSLSGVVTAIAPASSTAFATGGAATGISKFDVKIGLTRADPRLRPGMSAEVRILCARHNNVVLAPVAAIPFSGDQGTVTVWTLYGSARPRQVRLGLRNDHDAEVLSGLSPGQSLVVPTLSHPAE